MTLIDWFKSNSDVKWWISNPPSYLIKPLVSNNMVIICLEHSGCLVISRIASLIWVIIMLIMVMLMVMMMVIMVMMMVMVGDRDDLGQSDQPDCLVISKIYPLRSHHSPGDPWQKMQRNMEH